MLLEVATTLGATLGAFRANGFPPGAISVIFGIVLLISVFFTATGHAARVENDKPDPLPQAGLARMTNRLDGPRDYYVHSVPTGFALMGVVDCSSGFWESGPAR